MSAKPSDQEVAVIGCGLAGGMTGMLFAKRGFRVILTEKNEDWRQNEEEMKDDLHRSNIKRSINLALSHRGRSALKKIGLEAEVMKFAVPMRGRAIHTSKVSLEADAFQPYDENDPSNCIYSVSRERLNNLLLERLEAQANVTVLFNRSLTHIDRKGVAHFDTTGSGESVNTYNDYRKGAYQIQPRLIVGADGAYSVVRESLLRLNLTNFKRKYITHGYKELTIPPRDGKFALKNHNALHIWPRGSFMMIALPNPDKSFTATIFAPLHTEEGVPGLKDINSAEEIKNYMKTHFPDVLPVMPDYVNDFKQNPTSPLGDATYISPKFTNKDHGF